MFYKNMKSQIYNSLVKKYSISKIILKENSNIKKIINNNKRTRDKKRKGPIISNTLYTHCSLKLQHAHIYYIYS